MSIENENELEFSEEESQSEQPAVETPAEESAVVDEYTPNYNYSVKDEEFEFDEDLRSVVTSKETEEKLRDLYTRSAGLDGYKSKYGDLESQTTALLGGFNKLKDLRDSGDIRGLMKALNVDEDTILDYTEDLLTEKEMPEEQRKMLEENRELREKMNSFETKLNGFQEQEGNQRVENDLRELESLITSDSYLPVAHAMKSVGINMSDEVLSTGHMEFLRTGKEPTVGQVVKTIADKYAYLTTQRNAEEPKPVIPSVDGAGGTPVTQKITSIEDLKKLRASM